MSPMVVAIAWLAGISGAIDFQISNDEVESASLLQTKANSIRLQALHQFDDNAPLYDWCSMWEDVHVAKTLYGYNRDYSVPGYFPIAKSSDNTIEMHGFSCPAHAYRENIREGGSLTMDIAGGPSWTWLEGVATKVDDNLVEVFSPLHDPDKDRRHLLDGISIQDWSDKVKELCPGNPIADAVSADPDKVKIDWNFDYYVYSGQLPDTPNGGDYLMADAAKLFTFGDGAGFIVKGQEGQWRAWVEALKRCRSSLDTNNNGMAVSINGQLMDEEQYPRILCAISASPQDISKYWPCPWKDLPFASPPGSIQYMEGSSRGSKQIYLRTPEQRFVIQIRGTAGARSQGISDASGEPVWNHIGADMLVDVWFRRDLWDVRNGGTICGADAGYESVPSYTAAESLFSAEVVQHLCDTCNWVPKVGRTFSGASAECAPDCLPMPDCNVPPPAPQSSPPPTPEWMCEAESITLEDAMLACKDVQGDTVILDECMSDYCASGGEPTVGEIAGEVEEMLHPSTTTIPPTMPPAGPDDCFRGVDLVSFAALVAAYCPNSNHYVRCQGITDNIDPVVDADWWQVCQRSGGDLACDVAMRADGCAALAQTPPIPSTTAAATTTAAAVTSTLDPIVSFELKTPLYSNLGGQGPDLNSPASILYPDAGIYKGRKVSVMLSSTSPYVGKGSKNGISGALGRINVNTGTSVDFELSLMDADTGEAISVDGLPLTFLDLDEGEKGKGRASVSVCGAEQFVMKPSELTLTTDGSGVCKTATSSVKGTSKDNPSSVEAALTSEIASKRIVSYVYQGDTNVYAFTLTVAKGWKQRNLFFALKPGAACADDSNLPAQCAAATSREE